MESTSFDQNMKVLFWSFNKNGFQYNFRRDYNEDGEFHGVTLGMWDVARTTVSKFGTYDAEVINPFKMVQDKDIYMDLVRMVMWVLGRYFLTCGGNEIAKSSLE